MQRNILTLGAFETTMVASLDGSLVREVGEAGESPPWKMAAELGRLLAYVVAVVRREGRGKWRRLGDDKW